MKIVIDGYNIALSRGTGISTYGRGFVEATRALGHEAHLLFGQERGRGKGAVVKAVRKLADFAIAPIGFRACRINELEFAANHGIACPSADAVWNRSRLFRAAKGAFRQSGLFVPVHIPGVDIAHWTYPLPLFVPGAKNIYTIHDLVPLMFPWMIEKGIEEYRRTCAAIARRGDHILTVSDCSRQDIISMFDVDADRVINTYQAFDPAESLSHLSSPPSEDVTERWGLQHKGYFLFFGAIEPKKNVGRLLDAFEASGVETPLVIVAAGGWACQAERKLLAELTQAPGRRVRLYDYLPRADLIELIRHAKATLFPSIYEGFGLPVLESMALGTAVIASRVSALPEIVGKAGLLVDPLSVESIRDAICIIDADEARRVQLERRGLERSSHFSREAYRRRLADLFERLQTAV
jgi:glycosyltransferase involved in cell wall biosynthesis